MAARCLGLSRVVCVVCRLCCVTCALCYLLAVACDYVIRTDVVISVVREWITLLISGCTYHVLLRGFLLLPENTYVVKNEVKIKSDIVFLARNSYTVTVT